MKKLISAFHRLDKERIAAIRFPGAGGDRDAIFEAPNRPDAHRGDAGCL
jgi:hypothetical protein